MPFRVRIVDSDVSECSSSSHALLEAHPAAEVTLARTSLVRTSFARGIVAARDAVSINGTPRKATPPPASGPRARARVEPFLP